MDNPNASAYSVAKCLIPKPLATPSARAAAPRAELYRTGVGGKRERRVCGYAPSYTANTLMAAFSYRGRQCR